MMPKEQASYILADPRAVRGRERKFSVEKNQEKKVAEKARSPWGWSLNIQVVNSSGSKPKPGTDCKAL